MSSVNPSNGVVTQNQDTYYGCLTNDKSDTVIVDGGGPIDVEYDIRDGKGNPEDLSPWFDIDNPGGDTDPNTMGARFATGEFFAVGKEAAKVTILDAKAGKVQFTLPEYIYNVPGIYYVYFAVMPKDITVTNGKPLYVAPRKGVLLVEWTPFITHPMIHGMIHRVVPSVEDVRRKLDDFASKNDLMGEVEYSNDDIVHALIWPVRRFNELPPQLKRFRYSVMDFPYYDKWVEGAAAELLRISLIHLVRNKLESSHGGISGDEKNRDRDYMQIADMYRKEFDEWAARKKYELNMSTAQGWGTLSSPYRHLQVWR